MKTVEVALPDELAFAAAEAGLLASGAMENLLREKLRLRKADALLAAMERLSAHDASILTPEQVSEELAAMRATRRGSSIL